MNGAKKSLSLRIWPRCAAAVIAAGSAPLGAELLPPETSAEVRIVVDLTEEGRRLPRPSRERPVIYFPVTAQDIASGKDAPERAAVHRWLAQALAEQGYFPVSPGHDRPSQLLLFQWGGIEPQMEEMETRVDDDNPVTGQTFWNERDLLDLVAGRSANKPMTGWKRQKLREEAVAGRYFVRLIAYDYEAAKKKQSKVLWHARVSTHSDHATLAGVLPMLIKAGAPHFGRETKRPVVMQVPLAREGAVELGEPTVKEFLPATGDKPETPPGK